MSKDNRMNEMHEREAHSQTDRDRVNSGSRLPYRTGFSPSTQRSLLMHGLGWLGGLGVLSGGMVWAEPQTPDAIAPQEPSSAVDLAPAAEYAPAEPSWSATVEAAPIEPEWSPEPAPVEAWAPEPAPVDNWVPEPAPVEEAAPAAEAPIAPEQYEIEESPVATPAPAPEDYGNAYIDNTDYSLGATETYEEPNRVVLSERSTGCETVLEAGQGVSGGVCGTASTPEPVTAQAPAPGTASAPIPTWSPERQQRSIPKPTIVQAVAVDNGSSQPSYQPQEIASADIQSVNLGPVSLGANGIQFGNTTASGRAYFSLKRPIGRPGNGNASILFPLSIPAPITSMFGWRVHPIFGSSRFHSGTDLGAPMGTPVLAALAGKVAIADFLGGYGLTVVLEHDKSTKETLYAHLSEIFVRPGEEVKQGTVIGRVGSTGNSTGPHLHFEMRERTAEGWAHLDPGEQLEYALASFVGALQTAQAPTKAKSGLDKAAPKQLIPADKLPFVKIRG